MGKSFIVKYIKTVYAVNGIFQITGLTSEQANGGGVYTRCIICDSVLENHFK